MELQYHAEGQPRLEALHLLDLVDSNHSVSSPDSPTSHKVLYTARIHTRNGIAILPFYKGITTTSMVSNRTLKLNVCAKHSMRSKLTLAVSKKLGYLVTINAR
eukprot:12091690-Ditylum_brightwellii.AAC.1